MSRIQSLQEDGFMPLQNPEFEVEKIPLDLRHMPYGVRTKRRLVEPDQLGHHVLDPGTAGDIIGWVHWPTRSEDKRPIGAWAAAWPAIVRGPVGGGVVITPSGKPAGSRGGFAGVQETTSFGAQGGGLGGGFAGIKAGGQFGVQGLTGGFAGIQEGDESSQVEEIPCGGPNAGRLGGQVEVLPVLDRGFGPDDRFAPVVAALSSRTPKPAPGTVGILLAGTQEKSQEDLFFPLNTNELICVNFAGDPALSSIVYDLKPDNQLDEDRFAPLHSTWRVVRPRPNREAKVRWDPACNALAWQLGRSGQDVVPPITQPPIEGLGLCYDDLQGPPVEPVVVPTDGGGPAASPPLFDDTGAQITVVEIPGPEPPERTVVPPLPSGVLGAGGVRAGGPFDVGGIDDPHKIGRTLDKEPINSLHLQTVSLFRGTGGDGPLEFQAVKYSEPRALPLRTRVHLRWDPELEYSWLDEQLKGVWRWEAEALFGILIPPPKEPPPPPDEPPPPPKKPPPPPGKPPPPAVPGRGRGGRPLFQLGAAEAQNRAFERQRLRDRGLPIPARLGGKEVPGLNLSFDPSGWEREVKFRCRDIADPTEPAGVTTLPVIASVGLSRPSNTWRGKIPDVRRLVQPSNRTLAVALLQTPIVGRTESFGRVDTAFEPVWTKRPMNPESPFIGGTQSGGDVHMPPEVELCQVLQPGYTVPSDASSYCRIYSPGTRLGFGLPDEDLGCVKEGWEIFIDENRDLIKRPTADNPTACETIAGAITNTAGSPAGFITICAADGQRYKIEILETLPSIQLDAHEVQADWALISAPKLAVVSFANSTDNVEGVFALRVRITGTWGAGQPIEIESNPAPVGPVDISALTNLKIFAKATMTTPKIEVGLGDSVGTPKEFSTAQITITGAYVEYTFPLSGFTSVDLTQVDKLYYRIEGDATGDFFFDELRATV